MQKINSTCPEVSGWRVSAPLAQQGSSRCGGMASVEVVRSDPLASVEGTRPEAVVVIRI